jgi:hypothetical protein
MTLAVILLAGIFCGSMPAPACPAGPQAAQPTQPADAPPTQDKGTTPPSQKPPEQSPPPSTAPPAKAASGQTPHTSTKKTHHKKKAAPADCDTTSAATPASSASTPNSTNPATGSAPNTGGSVPCTPPKVIVQHGGTSEPSIQVAGGTGGDQASHQKDSANQMLDTTEANLKKIGDRQLNTEQQDMVTQIHQFMTQSKAAVGDGDLERARTLAWKAQLLSEELVKPEK